MPIALLSLNDKTGVEEEARRLIDLGYSLIGSDGTARAIAAAGLPVQSLNTLVGEPILGHRVVTLHPAVHAGLLARDTPEDRVELARRGFPWIDLVHVSLYPLARTIHAAEVTLESVIESTDIGGPTMLRSAAKGRRIVICERINLDSVLTWLQNGQPSRDQVITFLAAQAERLVSDYCALSAAYLINQAGPLPEFLFARH